MKKSLKSSFLLLLFMVVAESAQSQAIELNFTNRKVAADGLSWSFDLEAKGDDLYGGVQNGSWVAFNIRMDIALPAGVTITGGSGVGVANYTNGIAAVQTNVQGSPPSGQQEVGLTLERPDNGTDLSTTAFVKLATYTINFSGPVDQSNPATPRPIPNSPGSSWNNLAEELLKRPFLMPTNFALPVKLVSFNAKNENGIAQLIWETSEETNSERFDVQRSQNGKSWETIAKVAAKGESKVSVGYTAHDSKPLKGTNLYRLHMIDLDGTSSFSKILGLEFGRKSVISLHPNPVVNRLNINATDFADVLQIRIYNMKGLEVYRSGTAPERSINVEGLTAGMYVVKVTEQDNSVSSHKVLVTR
jgi:hypothetical protein